MSAPSVAMCAGYPRCLVPSGVMTIFGATESEKAVRFRPKSLVELRGPLPGVLLAAAFTVVTLLSLGPLIGIDRLLNFAFERAWPQFDPLMEVLAKFGQRGLLLPLLFGLAIFLARRRRQWEPIVITLVSLLTANFVVGVLKLATA